jgi:cyclopropane-fatty-acyl-phospholipid synthase
MSNSLSLTISGKRGFFEKKVLSLLSKMQSGKLNLSLPSGEHFSFGNGAGNIVANVRISNNDFFRHCLLYGDIGFGEAYVGSYWETDNIANVIKWFLLNIDNAPSVSGSKAKGMLLNFFRFTNKLFHLNKINSISGSKKNIAAHYDLNNDFFSLFLDSTMTYSAAYFKNSEISLEQAQEEKYDRLCKQLRLTPSDHVLEIGGGWGANAVYIAKKYGCKVTSVTISEEQYKFAQARINQENLNDKVEIVLRDYRFVSGKYDKIVSIEMLEAVGAQFLDLYFKKCNELLKKNGILAIQVITCPDSRFEDLRKGVDWIQKYIFPGSLLPSLAAINKAVNHTTDLTLVDLKDIGLHYATTLTHWQEKFNDNISKIKELGFNDQFIRKWNYYFSYCEAAFTMRNIHVMQLVYVRPNNILR